MKTTVAGLPDKVGQRDLGVTHPGGVTWELGLGFRLCLGQEEPQFSHLENGCEITLAGGASSTGLAYSRHSINCSCAYPVIGGGAGEKPQTLISP